MRNRDKTDALELMRAANPAPLAAVAATLTEETLEDELGRILAAVEGGTLGGSRDGAAANGRGSAAPVRRNGAPAGRNGAPAGRNGAPAGRNGAPARGTGARRPRRRLTLAFGIAFACATAAVAVLLLAGDPAGNQQPVAGGGPTDAGGLPLYTEAAMHVAEANPRLLVTAPGWRVLRADSFEVDSGEVTFGDGHHELGLVWYPAHLYGSYLRDRAQVSRPVHSTLLGVAATTVDYGDGADYATMLAPQGSVFVEIRGRLASRAEYQSVLHSLRAVSVDRWLAAMPAGVVKPTERATAVADDLRGVPYPSTFHPAAIAREEALLDRYQLGAKVSGEVTCGWLAQWARATATGDGAAATEAVRAMATSRGWPVLRRMASEGDYPRVVWGFADEIAAGHLDTRPSGYLVETDGTKYAIGPAYAAALGCESVHKRRVN